MTRNLLTDGNPFSVAVLNAMVNAHAQEGIVSGCQLTSGSGSFETDLTSGELELDGSFASVAADTIDHGSADTEDRIDLVTIDSSGSTTLTKGSPASTSGQPVAPDIPADEVLAAAVEVRGGASEIKSGDILDYRMALGSKRGEEVTTHSSVSDSVTLDLLDSTYHELSVTGDLTNWDEESNSPFTDPDDDIDTVTLSDSYAVYIYGFADVRVRQTSDFTEISASPLTAGSSVVQDAAISDSYLIYGGNADELYVHDINDSFNTVSASPLTQATDRIEGCDLDPDIIAYCDRNNGSGEVHIHDISDSFNTISNSPLTQAGDDCEDVAINDSHVAYSSVDGNVYVHQRSDYSTVSASPISFTDRPWQIDMNNSWLVAAAGNQDTIRIFDVSDFSEISDSPVSVGDQATTITLTEDFIIVGVAGSTGQVEVVEVDDWAAISDSPFASSDGAPKVSLSPSYQLYSSNSQEVTAREINSGIQFANAPSSPSGETLTVYAEDGDGSGAYDLEWPPSVDWASGTKTSSVSQDSDVEVQFRTSDGGDTWRARELGSGFL